MKKLILPLVLLLVLTVLPGVVADEPRPTMIPAHSRPLAAERVEVGPPAWYQQFLIEPSFEHGWTGWQWSGSAKPGFTFPRTGVMHAELCHEQGVNSWTWQEFTITDCREGEPIWFHVCVALFTGAGRPPDEDYTDVSQGWISDWQNLSHVALWERWDVDDHGQGYDCYWVQVQDMHLVGNEWTLNGACDTNYGGESSTVFILDDLEVWCDTGYTVFLPAVSR